MVYKLATGAFVAVGLFLLAMGVQRWLDQRSAARVADTFMTAVEHGDRAMVLSLLLPAVRARIEEAAQSKTDKSKTDKSKTDKSKTDKSKTDKSKAGKSQNRAPSQHPPQQESLGTQTDGPTDRSNGKAVLLTASPGTTHRIHHVVIRGDEAVVELRTEKNGFVSKPVLRLARSKTSYWKIVSIENGRVDPLWKDLETRRARAIEQRTAVQLQNALSKRPGVSVLRTQPDGPEDR